MKKAKYSILSTKYYESPFKKLEVRKNDIITKLFKNNCNESENEYYNLESIFE